MPLFTISKGGGPNADIPDGVYPVILTDISEVRTVTATKGPNAGSDIDLRDWSFAIDDPGGAADGVEIQASTSTASGPKSKMYSYLTALLGGQPPAIGTSFEKEQLVGRSALATIRRDEDGWPRIVNLGAMPAAMLRARQVPAPAPVAAPVAPRVAAPVAAAAPDLPF